MRSAEGKEVLYLEFELWLKLSLWFFLKFWGESKNWKDRNSASAQSCIVSHDSSVRVWLSVLVLEYDIALRRNPVPHLGRIQCYRTEFPWVLKYWQLALGAAQTSWSMKEPYSLWRMWGREFLEAGKEQERSMWETSVCRHTGGVVWRLLRALGRRGR